VKEVVPIIPEKLKQYILRLVAVNKDEGGTFETVKTALDEHRLAAFGLIDQQLENGTFTPEVAQRRKDDWDRRHNYI
jgi:hypothetical protein